MSRSEEAVNHQVIGRYGWRGLPWRDIEKETFKLQKRIYQASKVDNTDKVHQLQKLLLASRGAKLLAVRRVTQDNRGKNTAGVDGVKALSAEERLYLADTLSVKEEARPLRRVWIPKPGKSEKRPLGIPTLANRASQALVKMALEPEWEAKFEPNSYGFRPGRGTHDAIEAIGQGMRLVPQYVLDADIKGCFDNINSEALLDKLNTFPDIHKAIKGWLEAGVIDQRVFEETTRGTPQGGVISPLLANIALHGMETYVRHHIALHIDSQRPNRRRRPEDGKSSYYKDDYGSIKVIRYADDFVIMHRDYDVIELAKQLAVDWLGLIGLALSEEKTKIRHSLHAAEGEVGFNFLGFHVRQHEVPSTARGFKTLIKPSKEAQKRHQKAINELLRSRKNAPQGSVIQGLNPIVKGWCNYYRTAVSRKVFEKMSHEMHLKLWEWARKRHSNKGTGWRRRKYFRVRGNDQWSFETHDGKLMTKHSAIKIIRHTKVRGQKSPYDGDTLYWAGRLGRDPMLSDRQAKLVKRQKAKCGHCGLTLSKEGVLEIHHIDGNRKNHWLTNLMLIHGHCHDEVHRTCMNDNHLVSEEPYESKDSRTVLKQS